MNWKSDCQLIAQEKDQGKGKIEHVHPEGTKNPSFIKMLQLHRGFSKEMEMHQIDAYPFFSFL